MDTTDLHCSAPETWATEIGGVDFERSCPDPPFAYTPVHSHRLPAMNDAGTSDEMNILRARLDGIDGIETVASRPGNAQEDRHQGYVTMRADDQAAVERLLYRLGDPFWALFHVEDQKCELGFRVEVTLSEDNLQYELRFWGCPGWGLHRIRQFLARRVAGDVGRTDLPPLTPPGEQKGDRLATQTPPSGT